MNNDNDKKKEIKSLFCQTVKGFFVSQMICSCLLGLAVKSSST